MHFPLITRCEFLFARWHRRLGRRVSCTSFAHLHGATLLSQYILLGAVLTVAIITCVQVTLALCEALALQFHAVLRAAFTNQAHRFLALTRLHVTPLLGKYVLLLAVLTVALVARV